MLDFWSNAYSVHLDPRRSAADQMVSLAANAARFPDKVGEVDGEPFFMPALRAAARDLVVQPEFGFVRKPAGDLAEGRSQGLPEPNIPRVYVQASIRDGDLTATVTPVAADWNSFNPCGDIALSPFEFVVMRDVAQVLPMPKPDVAGKCDKSAASEVVEVFESLWTGFVDDCEMHFRVYRLDLPSLSENGIVFSHVADRAAAEYGERLREARAYLDEFTRDPVVVLVEAEAAIAATKKVTPGAEIMSAAGKGSVGKHNCHNAIAVTKRHLDLVETGWRERYVAAGGNRSAAA